MVCEVRPKTVQQDGTQKGQGDVQQKGQQRASEGPEQYQVYKGDNTTLQTREGLDMLRKGLLQAGGSAINEAHPGFMVLAEPLTFWLHGFAHEEQLLPNNLEIRKIKARG
jgi:hypothetical protein